MLACLTFANFSVGSAAWKSDEAEQAVPVLAQVPQLFTVFTTPGLFCLHSGFLTTTPTATTPAIRAGGRQKGPLFRRPRACPPPAEAHRLGAPPSAACS